MSADLTIRSNGFVEHAYRGQAGWTGLGNQINEDDDLDTIIVKGGLDWKVMRSRVRYVDETGKLHTMEDRVVTMRSDTKAALGIVSKDYQVVQPREVVEFFRTLLQGTGLKIETLGSLQGGKRVWCLARVGGDKEVVKGDKVSPYLLVCTSMDGTMATSVRYTTIRVVCHNTLRMALGQGKAGNGVVVVRHSTKWQVEAAQREMARYSDSFAVWMAQAQALQAKNIGEEQARSILAELFAKPVRLADVDTALVTAPELVLAESDFATLLGKPANLAADRPAAKVSKAESDVLALFQGAAVGNNIPGVAGTAWGLLNAVTQYVDHGTANSRKTQENRLQDAWWGAGDAVKVQAFQHLLAA